MQIQKSHNLGQQAAIQRLDAFLDQLMQQPVPGGVTIKDALKSWTGNAMNFSFKAKKGFLGTTIAGVVQVTDNLVELSADIPGLVKAFVSEDAIRAVIASQLDRLLGTPGNS